MKVASKLRQDLSATDETELIEGITEWMTDCGLEMDDIVEQGKKRTLMKLGMSKLKAANGELDRKNTVRSGEYVSSGGAQGHNATQKGDGKSKGKGGKSGHRPGERSEQ